MYAVFGALLALVLSLPVFANPIETSVWIDVHRGKEMTFRGHPLPMRGEGMGVVVLGNYIFTAAHVVWEAKEISVTTSSGAHILAVIVGIDADTDSFISFNPKRFVCGTSADVGFLTEDVFRREVSVEAVREFPGDFVVGVTDWESGKGELIDVKSATPDPFVAVRASMAMPVLYRLPVYVNGRRKYDGAVGIPFPAVELIDKWKLDGLIIFANHPREWKPKRISRVLEIACSIGMSPARLSAFLGRVDSYHEGLRRLRECKTPHLILWGSGEITAFTRDAKIIEAVAKRAYNETIQIFEHAGV